MGLDRIAVSILPRTVNELEKLKLRAIEAQPLLVEVRFDALKRSKILGALKVVEDIKDRAIYTLRSKEQGGYYQGSFQERFEDIKKLARKAPKFIDIELDDAQQNSELVEFAKKKSLVIVSFHDMLQTAQKNVLARQLEEMRKYSNYVKIVTSAKEEEDVFAVGSLYGKFEDINLIAFAMGEKGIASRFICNILGSPFTYASLDEPVAPGQVSIAKMKEVYGALEKKVSLAKL